MNRCTVTHLNIHLKMWATIVVLVTYIVIKNLEMNVDNYTNVWTLKLWFLQTSVGTWVTITWSKKFVLKETRHRVKQRRYRLYCTTKFTDNGQLFSTTSLSKSSAPTKYVPAPPILLATNIWNNVLYENRCTVYVCT